MGGTRIWQIAEKKIVFWNMFSDSTGSGDDLEKTYQIGWSLPTGSSSTSRVVSVCPAPSFLTAGEPGSFTPETVDRTECLV